MERCGAAVGHDLLGDGRTALGVQVRDDYGCALGGQRLRVDLADTAGGAGDDGGATGETSHGIELLAAVESLVGKRFRITTGGCIAATARSRRAWSRGIPRIRRPPSRGRYRTVCSRRTERRR